MSEIVVVAPANDEPEATANDNIDIAEAATEAATAAGEAAEAAAEAAEAVAEAAEAVAEAVEAVAKVEPEEEPEWRKLHAEHEQRIAACEMALATVASRLEEEPAQEEAVETIVPEPDVTPEQEEALEAADEQQMNFWRRLGTWL